MRIFPGAGGIKSSGFELKCYLAHQRGGGVVASTDLLLLLTSEGERRGWRVRMSSSERLGRCHMRSCVPVCV